MRQKIENTEKITLYMTERMNRNLRQDAERFEAFSNENHEIIMNSFLSCLLANYFNDYNDQQAQLMASIKETLNTYVSAKKEDELTQKLMQLIPQQDKTLFEGPKNIRVPLKPTTKTDRIITKLKKMRGEDERPQLSAPICDIFASYLSLPMYEREKIIFKKNVEILEEACETHHPLTLYLATAKDPEKEMHIVPYKLIHGSDEMFNYLLCQSYNEARGENVPSTMRLCRISEPRRDHKPASLEPKVVHLLDKMIERSPQYTIYEDIETRVRLTKDGIDTYSKIYFGRPTVIRKEPLPNSTDCIYVFNHSLNQLALYFRRFDAGQATILSPKELADAIKTFHEKSWKASNENEPTAG